MLVYIELIGKLCVRGEWTLAPLILNLDARRKRMVNFKIRPL